MKKLVKFLFSFVAAAAVFASCGNDQLPEIPAGTTISVDLTNLPASIPATNVPSITVTVTSDGEWLATSPEWITIDPSHAKGTVDVTLTVADNVDAEGKIMGPRTGEVVLSLIDADITAKIKVEQEGNADLDTRRTYVKVDNVTSGKAYLLVVKNPFTDKTFTAEYAIPILFGPTSSYGYPKPKAVTLEEDGSIKMDDESNGMIFVSAIEADNSFTIQQPDGRFVWNDAAYNSWSINADVTDRGREWKIDGFMDDGTVRITNVATGKIIQYGNGGYESFAFYNQLDETAVLPWLYEDTKAAVIDDSKCFFPERSVKVAADALEATFEISANVEWTLTKTEGDWITDFSPKSGSQDATVTVTFTANEGEEAREATFHLASNDGKKTADLTLTQAAAVVNVNTFAEIIADMGEEGKEFNTKNALVVAVGSTNTVLYDKTAYMFAYEKQKKSVVGDLVDLSGAVKTYNGCPEWDNPTITVISQKNEVVHPEAEVLDEAAFEAYSKAPSVKYVVAEGVRSGYLIKLGEKEINLYANDAKFEDGKTYKVFGYTIGYNSGKKQINMVLTSFEEVVPQYAKFELSKESDEVGPEAGAATFQVVADADVEWSLSIDPTATITIEGLEPNVFASSGTKNVTINYAANTNAAPIEYKVTVVTRANVEHNSLVYTLTQKAPEGSTALKFQWREDTVVDVTVPFNEAGAAHWYIDRDAAVDYSVEVVSAEGSVVTEGVTIEKEANHIAINYAQNTTPYAKVWRIVASTTNENAENKTLTATLTQGAYEYSDLAELNAAIIADGTKTVDRIINLTNKAEVTLISGTSVFAQNGTGAILLYGTGIENQVKTYQHAFIGKLTVKTTCYYGVPEITGFVTAPTAENLTGGGSYPCFNVTVQSLTENFNKYVNAKCKIDNVEVTKGFSSSSRNGEIKDATGTIPVYVKVKEGIVGAETGSIASKIVTWPTYNNTTKQLGYWADTSSGLGGITVTSIKGIITMAATKSLAVGDTFTLDAKANSNGAITYEITEGDAVTLADGVVTAVKAGTATIKATLAADDLYTEATATCVITVTDGEGGGGGEEVDPYSIDLTYRLGTNAYDDNVATVNEKADVKVIKIGTSSKKGEFTVVIPAGTKKITYYAVGWSGKNTTLDFQINGASAAQQALVANSGATGNSPFTLTVTDADKYEIVNDFAVETPVVVTTTTNARAILFGLKAE